MSKPRLLDLFCGAGGAAMGYHRAGFEVIGVDNRPQPHYPFEFHLADALEYCTKHGREFDVIHASPPCQFASEATPMAYRGEHPNLIPATRQALQATGRPYTIENVENARRWLVNPVMLCGTMFDLPIWRHRYFEVWPLSLLSPMTCQHSRRPITVHSGSHTCKAWEPVRCTGGVRQGVRPRESVDVIRWAMGIDWMTGAELSQAIPPAYTEWIGRKLVV
jgi:DNA (cytosine-5)-methyltransferase 1